MQLKKINKIQMIIIMVVNQIQAYSYVTKLPRASDCFCGFEDEIAMA